MAPTARVALCVAVLLFAHDGPLTAQARDAVVAFTNATVIDGTGTLPKAHTTVVVRGRLIESVFDDRSQPLPPGARVVDLTGRFLIPGLIDSHVHLGTQPRPPGIMEQVLRSVFLGGITSARDMGGSLRTVRPLAERSRADSVESPRVYYSAILAGPGRWFTGAFGENAADGLPMGTSPAVRLVDDRSDVVRVIADAKGTGATGIKIYNTVSPTLVRRFVDEAHRQGLRAWSHLDVDPGHPSDVIRAGMDVVSHGDQFRVELATRLPDGLSDSSKRAMRQREYAGMSPDDPRLQRILEQMRRAGTIFDPTLFIMLPQTPPADSSTQNLDRVLSAFRFASAMTRRANRVGIPIVAGTDGIGGSAANLHAELQLLVDSAGLSPLEALRAATINGARAIGIQDSVGSIAPGKIADLVVLRADPSRDIRNTQTVAMVVKGGRISERTTPMRIGPLAKPPVDTPR